MHPPHRFPSLSFQAATKSCFSEYHTARNNTKLASSFYKNYAKHRNASTWIYIGTKSVQGERLVLDFIGTMC
eukprot:3304926-Amphidinium_carterae.1